MLYLRVHLHVVVQRHLQPDDDLVDDDLHISERYVSTISPHVLRITLFKLVWQLEYLRNSVIVLIQHDSISVRLRHYLVVDEADEVVVVVVMVYLSSAKSVML